METVILLAVLPLASFSCGLDDPPLFPSLCAHGSSAVSQRRHHNLSRVGEEVPAGIVPSIPDSCVNSVTLPKPFPDMLLWYFL